MADKKISELDYVNLPLDGTESYAIVQSGETKRIDHADVVDFSANHYKGSWDAFTNTPTLTNGVGKIGDEYKVTVDGTQFSLNFNVGDIVSYDGSVWYKKNNSNQFKESLYYSKILWRPSPSGWQTNYSPSTTGSADNIGPSNTNLFTQTFRRRYASASTAGSSVTFFDSSFRHVQLGMGFKSAIKFGFEDAALVANARCFIGYNATGTMTNSDPSGLTNMIGIGADSGDTNFSWLHNDGTGSCTKTPLGANFPANTSGVDVYLLLFENEFGVTGEFKMTMIRLNTGHVARITVNSNITAGAGFFPIINRNNGTTALSVRLSLMDYDLRKYA